MGTRPAAPTAVQLAVQARVELGVGRPLRPSWSHDSSTCPSEGGVCRLRGGFPWRPGAASPTALAGLALRQHLVRQQGADNVRRRSSSVSGSDERCVRPGRPQFVDCLYQIGSASIWANVGPPCRPTQ